MASPPRKTTKKARIEALYGKKDKENITPPRPALLAAEARKLKKGDPASGRILSEEAQAVKQGVRKSKKNTTG